MMILIPWMSSGLIERRVRLIVVSALCAQITTLTSLNILDSILPMACYFPLSINSLGENRRFDL